MRLQNRLITPLLLCFLLCSCSKGTEDTYTIEVIDGVKHVHNHAPQWGDEPKVDLEFVLQIGGPEATDDDYQFYAPNDVALDREGNIYVVDAGIKRVQVYSPNGEYVATIGREGQGPGEFSTLPASIQIGSDGVIYIHENPPSRIHLFAPDRSFIDRIMLPRMMQYLFSMLEPDRFYMSYNDIREKIETSEETEVFLVGMYDKAGEVIREFCEPLRLEDIRQTVTANRHALEIDSGGNIYVAFYYQNRLDKYSSDGTHLLRFDRPLGYEISYQMGTRKLEILGQVQEYPYVIATKVTKGLGIDHRDRLWVPTYLSQPEEDEQDPTNLSFQVFSNEGIWLGSVPVPVYFSGLRIRGSYLFLTDDENTAVYEYSIKEH